MPHTLGLVVTGKSLYSKAGYSRLGLVAFSKPKGALTKPIPPENQPPELAKTHRLAPFRRGYHSRVPVHRSDARPGVKETAITRSQFGRAREPSVGGSRDGKGVAGCDGRHSGSGWLLAAMPD